MAFCVIFLADSASLAATPPVEPSPEPSSSSDSGSTPPGSSDSGSEGEPPAEPEPTVDPEPEPTVEPEPEPTVEPEPAGPSEVTFAEGEGPLVVELSTEQMAVLLLWACVSACLGGVVAVTSMGQRG